MRHFTVRAFYSDGRIKDHGDFASHQAAMNRKVELMHVTQNDDTEYYIVPLDKNRKEKT